MLLEKRDHMFCNLHWRGVGEKMPARYSSRLHGRAAIRPGRRQVIKFGHGARGSVEDQYGCGYAFPLIDHIVGEIDGQRRAVIVAAAGNRIGIMP